MTIRMGRPPLIDERLFVPRSDLEREQLLTALEAIGCVRPVRHRIVEWVERYAHAPRDADYHSDGARRDYRRWLAELGAPPWGDGYSGAGEAVSPFRGSSIGRARGC
jgi:hypothetical protein